MKGAVERCKETAQNRGEVSPGHLEADAEADEVKRVGNLARQQSPAPGTPREAMVQRGDQLHQWVQDVLQHRVLQEKARERERESAELTR